MPRFNPYQLERPQPKIQTKTFHDPAYPEPITLTLRAVREAPFRFRVQAKIDEYITDYVLGRLSDEKAVEGEMLKRFPPTVVSTRSGKRVVKIDIEAQTCKFIGVLEMMQVPAEGEPPYSFDELAAMSVFAPDAFIDAGLWAFELMTGLNTTNSGTNAETEETTNP